MMNPVAQRWEPLPRHWTNLFFYPVTPSHCWLCALPTSQGDWCDSCAQRRLAARPTSAAFLSYTWGRSRSPAYAFKARRDFDDGLRKQIVKTFGWIAHGAFFKILRKAYVVGVPPRTTFQWGREDHLDDLLSGLEHQLNLRVLRQVLAFSENTRKPRTAADIKVKNDEAAQLIRGERVILVDNLWNSGQTALSVAAKIIELGAAEVHLCIMGRWLEGWPQAIKAASDYRQSVCPNPLYIHQWYHEQAFGSSQADKNRR